jgi:hypothetical protein
MEKPPIVTQHRPPAFSRKYLYVALVVLVPLSLLVTWDLQPYFAYLEKKHEIQRLIPIGSNIDDAPALLKKKGYHFYDKDFTTVAKDYYIISVGVADKPRPMTLRVLWVLGMRQYYHWVAIEAGLDNRVSKVY